MINKSTLMKVLKTLSDLYQNETVSPAHKKEISDNLRSDERVLWGSIKSIKTRTNIGLCCKQELFELIFPNGES